MANEMPFIHIKEEQMRLSQAGSECFVCFYFRRSVAVGRFQSKVLNRDMTSMTMMHFKR